jgi:hypothetical protein
MTNEPRVEPPYGLIAFTIVAVAIVVAIHLDARDGAREVAAVAWAPASIPAAPQKMADAWDPATGACVNQHPGRPTPVGWTFHTFCDTAEQQRYVTGVDVCQFATFDGVTNDGMFCKLKDSP